MFDLLSRLSSVDIDNMAWPQIDEIRCRIKY